MKVYSQCPSFLLGASKKSEGLYTKYMTDTYRAYNNTKRSSAHSIKGLSLLEIMMVIAITAIVLIIAVNYYTNVRQTSKVNQTVMQVRDLYQGGVNYFNTQKYQAASHATTSDITSTLISGNYIPPGDQTSPWGNNQKNMVKVTFSAVADDNQLIIIIPALPTQACKVLTDRLQGPFPDATYSSCTSASTNGLTITFTLNFTN